MGGYPRWLYRFADAGGPAFWDLDEDRKIVADPQHVIFLIGWWRMTARVSQRESAAWCNVAAREPGAELQRDYDTLANTLASAMTGAIDSFRGAGIGPETPISTIASALARLNLTDYDLDSDRRPSRAREGAHDNGPERFRRHQTSTPSPSFAA